MNERQVPLNQKSKLCHNWMGHVYLETLKLGFKNSRMETASRAYNASSNNHALHDGPRCSIIQGELVPELKTPRNKMFYTGIGKILPPSVESGIGTPRYVGIFIYHVLPCVFQKGFWYSAGAPVGIIVDFHYFFEGRYKQVFQFCSGK